MPNRTPLTDEALCAAYGVAIYAVENLPDHNPKDAGKFEVTTLAEDFPESLSIPLADSYEAALALAIERLGLAALYAAEQQAGHALPRRTMLS